MTELSDNNLASMTDAAVRSALSDAASIGLGQGADTSFVLTSVLTGGVCAIARFIHALQQPGFTPEEQADAVRGMVLSFLVQAEANASGGTA